MLSIQLIYDQDCPNIDNARNNLKQALKQSDNVEEWLEFDVNSPDCPDYAKNCGSPSVFVNQKDVSQSHLQGEKECCRLYQIDTGETAVAPTVNMILESIQNN